MWEEERDSSDWEWKCKACWQMETESKSEKNETQVSR